LLSYLLYRTYKKANIILGFEKCDIISLNLDKILSMIPNDDTPDVLIGIEEESIHVNNSVLNILKE